MKYCNCSILIESLSILYALQSIKWFHLRISYWFLLLLTQMHYFYLLKYLSNYGLMIILFFIFMLWLWIKKIDLFAIKDIVTFRIFIINCKQLLIRKISKPLFCQIYRKNIFFHGSMQINKKLTKEESSFKLIADRLLTIFK